MAKLADLIPTNPTAQLSVGEVEYHHIPTARLPDLAIRNIALAAVFQAGEEGEDASVSMIDLIRAAPRLVSDVIAISCDLVEDLGEAQAKVDAILGPDDQSLLFHAIINHSFPSGIAGFFGRLFSVAGGAKSAAATPEETTPETTPTKWVSDEALIAAAALD